MLLAYEKKNKVETFTYEGYKVVNGVEIPDGFDFGIKGLSWDNPIWTYLSPTTKPLTGKTYGISIVPSKGARPLVEWTKHSVISIAPCGSPVVFVYSKKEEILANGWEIHPHSYSEYIGGFYFPIKKGWYSISDPRTGKHMGDRTIYKADKTSACGRVYQCNWQYLAVIKDDLENGIACAVNIKASPANGLSELNWENTHPLSWVIWDATSLQDLPSYHYKNNGKCKAHSVLKTELACIL
jgi:hypothetical protein